MNDLWCVGYTVRFESSSGMKRYHIDRAVCIHVVAGSDLESVKAKIQTTLTCQERLLEIRSATYLGRVLL